MIIQLESDTFFRLGQVEDGKTRLGQIRFCYDGFGYVSFAVLIRNGYNQVHSSIEVCQEVRVVKAGLGKIGIGQVREAVQPSTEMLILDQVKSD